MLLAHPLDVFALHLWTADQVLFVAHPGAADITKGNGAAGSCGRDIVDSVGLR